MLLCGESVMARYIARANIDHYLNILNADVLLGAEHRAAMTKRLIAEEDRLSHDLEQLQFAEDRAAKGRERLKQVQRLRNKADPMHRANAEPLAANVEAIQNLLDSFCDRLRTMANSRL